MIKLLLNIGSKKLVPNNDKLMIALHNIGLAHCLNILVVSDHGAASASCSSSFYLESFVPNITAKAHVFTGAVGRLRAVSGDRGKA